MKMIFVLTFCYLIISGLNANLFAQTTTTTTTTATATTTTTIVTPVATPTPEVCEVKIIHAAIKFNGNEEEASDKAKIKGTFSGFEFDLDEDDVTVIVGNSSKIISSGSFDVNDEGDGWEIEDEIDGADVEMEIRENDDGTFKFSYEVKNVDLSVTVNPLIVMLEIGENSCNTEVRLNGELQFRGDDDDGIDDVTAIDCEKDGNIIIDGCNTDVAGDTAGIGEEDLCAEIQECANNAKNHGRFVSCVSKLLKDLRDDGIISNDERKSIRRCASRSDVGKKDDDHGK